MKTIAALIFLGALAIVLVQPVLGADDEPATRTRGRAATSDDPSPDGEGSDGKQGGERVRLTARYPERCMRPADGGGTGLVAARRGSVADVGFPDQRPVARIEVSGDVAWSPSGTFLAERGGRVFDQSGNPQGALFFEPRKWQWSPVADCALATTENGRLSFSIPDTKRKGIRLLNAPVTDFDLSPDGRRLAVVVEDRGLHVADLRRGRIVRATESRASIAGWFSDAKVLFSKSRGAGKLRYATAGGRAGVVRGAFVGGSLVRCPGELVTVGPSTEGGTPFGRLIARAGRIRAVATRTVSDFALYPTAACSPDATFIAASTQRPNGERGPLVLLNRDGSFVRELARGRTANPRWSDEGLMYVKFGKSGRGRLWLIAPGAAAPVPTPYRVGAPTQYDWHVRQEGSP